MTNGIETRVNIGGEFELQPMRKSQICLMDNNDAWLPNWAVGHSSLD